MIAEVVSQTKAEKAGRIAVTIRTLGTPPKEKTIEVTERTARSMPVGAHVDVQDASLE